MINCSRRQHMSSSGVSDTDPESSHYHVGRNFYVPMFEQMLEKFQLLFLVLCFPIVCRQIIIDDRKYLTLDLAGTVVGKDERSRVIPAV